MSGQGKGKGWGIGSSVWNYLKTSNDQQRGGIAGYVGNTIVVVGAILTNDMAAIIAGVAAFVSDAFFLFNKDKKSRLYSLGQLTGAAAVEMYRRSGAPGDNQTLKYLMLGQVVLLGIGALKAPLEWATAKSRRIRKLQRVADRIPGSVGLTMPWIRVGVLLSSWGGLNLRMAMSQTVYCYADIMRGSMRESVNAARYAMMRKKAAEALRPANDPGNPLSSRPSNDRDVA